jgi:DNA-directed RNA polymerase specialized sigma24 family protein
MSIVNLNKHYAAFKWAVSTNWKDKNGLYSSIQYKMHVLKKQYGLTEEGIVDELFEQYWERGHYRKFDETKGSLNNWIARYVNLYLNHLIRRYATRAKNNPAKECDPLDQRNWANLEWIDRDNEREDLDYHPEIVFDPTNPEDLCIAKETLEFISSHFEKNEFAYLMGEIELNEAAELSGCSCDAFRKSLERRRSDFRNAMRATEC